jgi:chemotaxis protein MotB
MMALARARHRPARSDYWPAFVDVMTNLLLVFVFLLSIFALVQFFLSQEISGRDTVLNRLNAQIAELTELLALEKATSGEFSDNLLSIQANLTAVESERDRLRGLLDSQTNATLSASERTEQLTSSLEAEQQLSRRALSQVELLSQQISALRRQIAALEGALEISEARDRESQTKIADLGRRLNVALAQRVQELARYRSDFFGRLREILGERQDIRIVGDRFVFQSEVLFGIGSDQISEAGLSELNALANAVLELEQEIPEDIPWVLRVDGHTDKQPLAGTGRFRTNWELSAGRAISVVRFLIDEGIPANRLAAAGFGEFQPIDAGETDQAYARNRRIELKLTER